MNIELTANSILIPTIEGKTFYLQQLLLYLNSFLKKYALVFSIGALVEVLVLLLESPTICLEIPFLIPGIPMHAPITRTVPKIPDTKGISIVFPKFELFLFLIFLAV